MFFILNKSSFLACLLVISILIVYGCSSNIRPPVEQRVKNEGFYKSNKKGFNKNKKSAYHTVKKGDSLYSIAWQYGLDFKTLAKWNYLKSPYLIYAGKKLRIKPKIKRINKKKSKKYRKRVNTRKKVTKKTSTTKNKKKNKKTVITKKQLPKVASNKLNWVWPAKGRVIQRFSPSKGKKGIDISLPNKTRIKATESGKVVYSGHGLTGYGLLIIVKHNNQYLSAYAHNSKLFVEVSSASKESRVEIP